MTKERKILLNYLLKQYKQQIKESLDLPVAFQMLTYFLGNTTFKFQPEYGSLWKSKNNVVYIRPSKPNAGFSQWMNKHPFVDHCVDAGGNPSIYKVVINKSAFNKFKYDQLSENNSLLKQIKQSDKFSKPQQQLKYIKAFGLFAYISPNRAMSYIEQAERFYKNKNFEQLKKSYDDIWQRMN